MVLLELNKKFRVKPFLTIAKIKSSRLLAIVHRKLKKQKTVQLSVR